MKAKAGSRCEPSSDRPNGDADSAELPRLPQAEDTWCGEGGPVWPVLLFAAVAVLLSIAGLINVVVQ